MHLEKKPFKVKLIILYIFIVFFFYFLLRFFHAMPYLA